ncbi:MAG: class II aldolase/adducin family protein [Nakamurella sp.]
MSAAEPDHTIVRRVVQAGRALAAAGQSDMVWGHVALRDPRGRGVWMKAAGWSFDEVTPERVLLVGWDGNRLLGDGAVHLECHLHLSVLSARADVDASVHTHPPAVNAFSALAIPLLAISHDGVLFADPQVPRSALSGDLIADPGRGDRLAAELGAAPACLLPRHGLVAVGAWEGAAVMHAVLLTAACSVMLQASAAGTVLSWSDADEIAMKKIHAWPASQLRAGYDHLVRAADRRFPPT